MKEADRSDEDAIPSAPSSVQADVPATTECLGEEPLCDEALSEALDQLTTIEKGEDERRKTVDAKLSSAQNAVGFIVTLAGGSVALAFLQSPVYDVWHGCVILSLTIAVGFFVWAAHKIVVGNDPAPYQSRVAPSVRRLLKEGKTKQDLQRDAVNDLVANITANAERNNTRMTYYRAAIDNIRKGVFAAGVVPVVVLIAYAANALVGERLPAALRIPNATASPTSIPTPATQTPTPKPTMTRRAVSTSTNVPHSPKPFAASPRRP